MTAPRIALDARTIVGRKTGDRTYTLNLLRGLARVESRFHFDVLLDRDDAGLVAQATQDSPRFQTHILPAQSSRTWSLLALPRWAWQHRPALVHVHYLAPGVLPCPFVTTIHDVVWRALPQTFPVKDRAIMNLGMPLTAKLARRILTVSAASRGEIARRLRVAPAKISVTPNAVERRFFEPVTPAQSEQLRAKYDLGRAPYVLSVGVLQPRKNLARLMRAFSTLGHTDPDLPHQLVITGKTGWGAQPATGDANIRFTGYVEDDELPALYAGAEVFAYPSLYEGFGLPVIEAMAAGAPVLTSNRSSLPEIAGDAAVKVDPYEIHSIRDGLRLLLRDADLRGELRQRGKTWAAQFTIENQARATLAAYDLALGKADVFPSPSPSPSPASGRRNYFPENAIFRRM